MPKSYRIRYSVEAGSFTPPGGGTKPIPGVVVSADHHGYADDLLVVSFVDTGDGPQQTCLVIPSTGGDSEADRANLVAARDAINHYLERHA